MKFTRRLRSLVALFALFGVLFSQLAVSAYVCPGLNAMAAGAAAMAEMPDCAGMPETQRDALCNAHCQQGDQSRDTPAVSLPDVAGAGGAGLLVSFRIEPAGLVVTRGFGLQRRIEPPDSIRHCRLHI